MQKIKQSSTLPLCAAMKVRARNANMARVARYLVSLNIFFSCFTGPIRKRVLQMDITLPGGRERERENCETKSALLEWWMHLPNEYRTANLIRPPAIGSKSREIYQKRKSHSD